jgi:hypothetical protein
VFNQDLDALNDKPFLAYLEPSIATILLRLQRRQTASFKRLQSYSLLEEIFTLLGERERHRINTGFDTHWQHKKKGWKYGEKYPTQAFREIDFLSVLLGSDGRSRSSIALSDQHLDLISNIRIDFDFDKFSAEKSIKLALEIEDKMAAIGLSCYFFITGHKGLQVSIPLPDPITQTSALLLWNKLQNYLSSDQAKIDVCNVNGYLRIPLGRHSLTMLLSAFFDPHTGLYYSINQQLDIYRKSLLWSLPEHIGDPLGGNSWEKFVADEYTKIPQKAVQISTSTETSKVQTAITKQTRKNQNWNAIWTRGLDLDVGEFNEWLGTGLGMRAAYNLFGQAAPTELEKLALSLPEADLRSRDRFAQIAGFWAKFIPSQDKEVPENTSLELMLASDISAETTAKAHRIFESLKDEKTSSNRSINKNLLAFIEVVLHGISVSADSILTISISDLHRYYILKKHSINKRTLDRLIDKHTVPETAKIRTRNSNQNPLAVFYRHKAPNLNFQGTAPAGFELVFKFKNT